MLEQLKKDVFNGNLELFQKGIVIYTWGNVSAIDENHEYVVIKPSGIDYNIMNEEDMVVTDLQGNVVEGELKPSTDLYTHLELYKSFPKIKSVVHTHSVFAVSFAQAGRDIIAFGTTHADTFHGDVPCTRELTCDEVKSEYEKNTGIVISECIQEKIDRNIFVDELDTPGILVRNHGPFTWGESIKSAVYNSVVLEEVAKIAYNTIMINPQVDRINQYVLDKHYYRKHGKNAYYGNSIK